MGLTIVFASTTVYESGIRTTLTSTSTATSTSTSTATSVSTTTSTTTQTTTVTSTFDPTKALTDAYLAHIGAIESQNATALAAEYETNATLLYTSPHGAVFPSSLDGSVDGVANITRFHEGSLQENKNNSQYVSCVTCFDLKVPFTAANETHSITVSSDEKAGNVTANLVFYSFYSPSNPPCYVMGVGPCKAGDYAIGFDISYVLQGDRWLISTESLAYVNSSACTTAYSSASGSVFHCQFSSG